MENSGAYAKQLLNMEREGEALTPAQYSELDNYHGVLEEERFQQELARTRKVGLGFLVVDDPVGDKERIRFFRDIATFWIKL